MSRAFLIRMLVLLAVAVPLAVFADAYSDLLNVQTAFQHAKSWHADEHLSNGRLVAIDFVAPDRWRIQPSPGVVELVIHDDFYVVRKGHATKLPFSGGMMRKLIQDAGFSVQDDVKQSARDLGTQTLDHQRVHAYSYTTRGVPVTLYVGANSLPVETVVNNNDKSMTTIKYSQFNAPISIQAP
jgi:hypothetical protein